MAISTVPNPSGSGRADMLTSPVSAARAAVATGAWVKSKHDIYLIRGSVGAPALVLPIHRWVDECFVLVIVWEDFGTTYLVLI